MSHTASREPGSFAHGKVRGQVCPRCRQFSVVYDGNYFCLRDDGSSCGWAMERDEPQIIGAYLMQCADQAVADGDQETAQRMAFYLNQLRHDSDPSHCGVMENNTALNLYHLKRLRNDYLDRMSGMVVATLTEKDARKIAWDEEPDRGAEADWLNPEITSCRLIGVATPDVQVGCVLHDITWS